MEHKPVKIGIVGLGDIAAHVHLPIWCMMSDKVKVVAICDNNQERLGKISEQFQIQNTYDNLKDMLSNEQLDLVDVCTPPRTHKDIVVATLKAGVNCITEKPIATSLSDVDEMIKASKDNKRRLFAIHNYSFVPALRKARALISSGIVGDILQVNVKLSIPLVGEFDDANHWSHKLPGGLFGELAPHACFVMTEFTKGKVTDVKAQILKKTSYPYLLGDELTVMASTDRTLGSFSVSLNSPTRRMTIDIIGSKLWLSIDAEAQVLVKYPPIPQNIAVYQRGERALSDIFQRIGCLCAVSFGVATRKYKAVVEGHSYLFKQAITSLKENTTYPIELDDLRRETQILETAFTQIT